MLGDEEDLRRLCEKARARGMHVMLDGVFNHTGNNSRYFNALGAYPSLGAAQSPESPYYDWYSSPPLAGPVRLLVGHPHPPRRQREPPQLH